MNTSTSLNICEEDDSPNAHHTSFAPMQYTPLLFAVDDDSELSLSPPATIETMSGCRLLENIYVVEDVVDEGTYGVVFRARDIVTDKIYAIKHIKSENFIGGFPITALREITILRQLSHKNVVKFHEVCVSVENVQNVHIVMEYVENTLQNVLKSPISSSFFTISAIKRLIYDLCDVTAYMHSQFIMHRDLKMSNLLYARQGELKICDLGLACTYDNPLRSLTPTVQTLWYRAPEIFFSCLPYGPAIDCWSIGCIFAEIIIGEPLFSGETEMEMIGILIETLGIPSQSRDDWPEFEQESAARHYRFKWTQPTLRNKIPSHSFDTSEKLYLGDLGFDLLSKFLTYNPKRRITAEQAMQHAWFQEEPKMQKTLPIINGAIERRNLDTATNLEDQCESTIG